MRDCYRPVLVFAPAAANPAFTVQQAYLEEYADDMMDRDLLFVPVLVDARHFKRPLDAPFVVLKQAEVDQLRARFAVSPSEFLIVLVGKDGGEKFRGSKPISVLKLDGLVDAMPMRQQEKNARPGSKN